MGWVELPTDQDSARGIESRVLNPLVITHCEAQESSYEDGWEVRLWQEDEGPFRAGAAFPTMAAARARVHELTEGLELADRTWIDPDFTRARWDTIRVLSFEEELACLEAECHASGGHTRVVNNVLGGFKCEHCRLQL